MNSRIVIAALSLFFVSHSFAEKVERAAVEGSPAKPESSGTTQKVPTQGYYDERSCKDSRGVFENGKCLCNGVEFRSDFRVCREWPIRDPKRFQGIREKVTDLFNSMGQAVKSSKSGTPVDYEKLTISLGLVFSNDRELQKLGIFIDKTDLEKKMSDVREQCKSSGKLCTAALNSLEGKISSLNDRVIDIEKKGRGYTTETKRRGENVRGDR